jgi:hypothetical protein
MSRTLRPLFLLACLTTLPALAAQSLDASTHCPGTATDERAAPTDADAAPPAAPAATSKAGAGGSAAEADSVQRSRPRWQSFLPGMVR